MTHPVPGPHSCATCHTAEESDVHPMVHYGPNSYHYDCLPAKVKADLLGDGSTAQQRRLAALIAHADEGDKSLPHLHGEELRTRAVELRTEIPDEAEGNDNG
jgi:hypothetical protein